MKTLIHLTFVNTMRAVFFLASAALAQVVEIPDAGLRTAICAALNVPVGELTVADMDRLTVLNASLLTRGYESAVIGSLEGLQAARNLTQVDLSGSEECYRCPPSKPNLRTGDLSLLAGLTTITNLNLSWNQLTNIILADGLTSLTTINLIGNGLTNGSFLSGLSNLTSLSLSGNRLSDCSFLSRLTRLSWLDLGANQFTNITLTTGLMPLGWFNVSYNPLTTLVIPELLVRSLSPSLQTLRDQGVVVYLYPISSRLTADPLSVDNTFHFTLAGPPGSYRVQVTDTFSKWTDLELLTNRFGSAVFGDSAASGRARGFYRIRLEP